MKIKKQLVEGVLLEADDKAAASTKINRSVDIQNRSRSCLLKM